MIVESLSPRTGPGLRPGLLSAPVSDMLPLMDRAIAAAFAAGKEILDVYARPIDVELKDDRSPLTEADKRAHGAIMRELRATGIPVLSEEGKEVPVEERQAWQQYWLVDPLDGTKEFIKRNGEFTVNIALMHPIPAFPGGEGGNAPHPRAFPGGEGGMHQIPGPSPVGKGGMRSTDARYTVSNARKYGQMKEWARGMRKEPTDAERAMWRMLRHDSLGARFRRQHILEDFIVDFACLKKRLVVEIDGPIHEHSREEDALRTARLLEMGFHVVRFTNEEVMTRESFVFESIKQLVDTRPDLTSSLEYDQDPLESAHSSLPTGEGRGGVNSALGTHTPIAAVLYVPVMDTLYFAWNGGGSYRMDRAGTQGTTSALKLAALAQRLPLSMSRDTFTIVASRSHNSPDTDAFIARMKEQHGEVAITSMGSALKICLVAEGAADAYPRYAPTMEWDTAAGHAIANEAGKQLIDVTTDAPMRYNKSSLVNNWFIVQ